MEALREVEKALREELEKYRFVVENARDAVVILQNGVVKFSNQKAAEMAGCPAEQMAMTPITDLVHPEDRNRLLGLMTNHPKAEGGVGTCVFRLKQGNREDRWFHCHKVPITWEGEPATLSFLSDITRHKRLEAQIRQAQKMEAMGTLAGGIAHDFNNILGAIIGYTELMLFDIPEDTRVRTTLKHVLEAGYRAKDLVKQIVAFSRQSEQEFRPVKMSLVIKEALNLLRASLPTTIAIVQDIPSDLPLVKGDSTQIHQVLMNLCANAAHAMRVGGGTLQLGLGVIDYTPESVAILSDLQPGRYVRLEVSDTGHGMTRDTVDRIFDPFFTTKEKGQGTGMGLSVVHGIVESHGGAITVYSEPGRGSSFHVYLPALEGGEEAHREPLGPVPGGTESVLFLDDEKALVEMGKQLLERLGYTVVGRSSSIEALEAFRAQPDKFDLVITDMTMPHMTGDALARELMRIRPAIPIILCTGFSEQISEEKAAAMGIKGYIMKPLVIRELAQAIRKALDPTVTGVV